MEIKNIILSMELVTIEKDIFFEWDGFCPESFLKGEKVRMKLNRHDFYESEKTGLQIALSYPGFLAAVLNFRGKGKFKTVDSFADKAFNYEILSKQESDRFPFCGNELMQDTKMLSEYISTIKDKVF